MCPFDKFISIINNSKEFSFEYGTILVLRDYRTGEKIKIDLANLNEDAFEEMYINEDDEDEND